MATLADKVTAALIAELRLLVNEPDGVVLECEDPYSDDDLKAIIAKYPLVDELGSNPTSINRSTVPPSYLLNIYWIPTFDLNRAAAHVWLEKAGRVSRRFAYSVDGSSFSSDQMYKHYHQQYKTFWSRRAPRTMYILTPDTTDNLAISSNAVI